MDIRSLDEILSRPASAAEEHEAADVLRKALGMEDITCDGCMKAKAPEGMTTEIFGYQDHEHNCYWQWMIPKARMIAKRDQIRVEPLPVHWGQGILMDQLASIDHAHAWHLPMDKLAEPMLVAMLPIQPFGATAIIDGNHRAWRLLMERQRPLMQILNPVQSAEALKTAQDDRDTVARIRAILKQAAAEGKIDMHQVRLMLGV